MKKLFIFLVLNLLFLCAIAQVERGFQFQGYARGVDGTALQSQDLEFKFSILNADESVAYSETQNLTTDEFGVFQATIGSSGLDDLNFSNNNYKLKVEVMSGGALQLLANTDFLAVPYAKSAETAYQATNATNATNATHADEADQADYATLAGNGVPIGCIMPFAGPEDRIPDGWLLCDGRSLSRSGDYYALYSAIGITWGFPKSEDAEGNKYYNLPDLRGVFLRGVNGGAIGTYSDPNADERGAKMYRGSTGNTVGTYQADVVGEHNHNVRLHTPQQINNYGLGGSSYEGDVLLARDGSDVEQDYTISTELDGGLENRPVNAAVYFIIKYK